MIILVIFKSIVGLITNSDALSSIITIIGTKLSNKRPNKKHPYGYGRIEIEVFDKYEIILTIGVYASNEVGEFKNIKKYSISILKNYKNII